MSRRAMLALAAAITAFVLVTVGGVASYAVRTSAAPSAQLPDTKKAEVAAVPIAEPASVNTPAERDDEGRAHGHHDRRRSRHHEDDDG